MRAQQARRRRLVGVCAAATGTDQDAHYRRYVPELLAAGPCVCNDAWPQNGYEVNCLVREMRADAGGVARPRRRSAGDARP